MLLFDKLLEAFKNEMTFMFDAEDNGISKKYFDHLKERQDILIEEIKHQLWKKTYQGDMIEEFVNDWKFMCQEFGRSIFNHWGKEVQVKNLKEVKLLEEGLYNLYKGWEVVEKNGKKYWYDGGRKVKRCYKKVY